MPSWKAALALALATAALPTESPFAEEPLPAWAYAVNPPGMKPSPDDGVVRRVPGSERGYTLTQIRDLYNVPDWHPGDHPSMPGSVVRGGAKGAFACGFCHLPNGQGRPENASLAGLPASYIIQQVADLKAGTRRSSEPKSLPANLMTAVANAATEAEVREAAVYFAGLRPRSWIRVVETPTVPQTKVAGWMLVAVEPAATEAIGMRIIEMPENLERTELRDSTSGFIAYVPPGSLHRGKELVTSGAGKTNACGVCHGQDLRGLGPIPALAGRSPSYIVRQLVDLQRGARAGAWSPLMKGVVAGLKDEDIVAIAAYTASLAP